MKVSIFGAGRVGISIAYSLLHTKIADEMVIVDIDIKRAEGEVLDLYHSTPFLKRCNIIAGNPHDILNSDFVIITAGASQSAGESRLSLTKRNVKIIRQIAAQIKKYSPDAIVINVSNPVDVLSYVLWKETKFNWRKVIGTGTILDTARFRALVAKQCGVSPMSVHAYIIGEHGDSELLVWSNATIGGVSIKRFCQFCTNKNCTPLESLFEQTKNAAYEIIEKKGATNLAIGTATAALVESIYRDEKRVWTVSVFQDNLYIGFPAILGKNGVEKLVPVKLNSVEKEAFERSKEVIKKYIKEGEKSEREESSSD